jgi:hypothetical protein
VAGPFAHRAVAGVTTKSLDGARGRQRDEAEIAAIAADAWTPIAYREAVYDETGGRWVSRAEVA